MLQLPGACQDRLDGDPLQRWSSCAVPRRRPRCVCLAETGCTQSSATSHKPSVQPPPAVDYRARRERSRFVGCMDASPHGQTNGGGARAFKIS